MEMKCIHVHLHLSCILIYSSLIYSIAADFRASSMLGLALGEIGALGPSSVTELLLQAGPTAAQV